MAGLFKRIQRQRAAPILDPQRNPYYYVWWVLDPRDKYRCCPDCQRYAVGSPYSPPGSGVNELDATPGDGHTRCGAGCTCKLSHVPPDQVTWLGLSTLSPYERKLRSTPPEQRRDV